MSELVIAKNRENCWEECERKEIDGKDDEGGEEEEEKIEVEKEKK